MKKPHAPDIRRVLVENPDGLTISRIHRRLPDITHAETVRNALERMPDAYIDRWTTPIRGQYQAVWRVVVPPRHCPYPTDRYKPETRWATGHQPAA